MTFETGGIYECLWWPGALGKEPNKDRPALVVQDSALFGNTFPNVVVVPCARYPDFAVESLCVAIDPDPSNGLTAVSYAIGHSVTVVAKERLGKQRGSVPPKILAAIRATIAETLGLVEPFEDEGDGPVVVPLTRA